MNWLRWLLFWSDHPSYFCMTVYHQQPVLCADLAPSRSFDNLRRLGSTYKTTPTLTHSRPHPRATGPSYR